MTKKLEENGLIHEIKQDLLFASLVWGARLFHAAGAGWYLT